MTSVGQHLALGVTPFNRDYRCKGGTSLPASDSLDTNIDANSSLLYRSGSVSNEEGNFKASDLLNCINTAKVFK